jgi:hypothetical protein
MRTAHPRPVVWLLALALALTGVSAVVAPASAASTGHITGTVTGPDHRPLVNVEVTVYSWNPYGEYWVASSFDTRSDVDGSYDVDGLWTGNYRLQFWADSMAMTYFGGSSTVAGAADITVTDGATTAGKDVELTVAEASISGAINTSPEGPAPDGYVTAYLKVGDAWEAIRTRPSTRTYKLDKLPAGTYRLRFEGNHYATEYWTNALTFGTATELTVATGESITGKDVQLEPSGYIYGKVTGPGGQAPGWIEVSAYLQVGGGWEEIPNSSSASTNGAYVIYDLPAGTYRLRFRDDHDDAPYGSPFGDYVSEYWNDAASLETAQDITVSVGQAVRGVNAELAETGGPLIGITSLPTISGPAHVGSTLTANAGSWVPSTGLTFSYEWLVDGLTVATGPSYTPTHYVGVPIQVRVTASKDGYRPRTATSGTTAALSYGPAPLFLSVPGISGAAARVGVPVTATPGSWTSDGGPVSYEWLIGDPAVASGPSYTPVAADAGKTLRIRTTAWAPWGAYAKATSPGVTIEKGRLTAIRRPHLTGKAKKNATLSVTRGAWSPSAGTGTVQWYAAGKPIAKATSTRLKLRGRTLRAVAGKEITVQVTTRAPGYTRVITTLTAPGKAKL